MKLIDYVNSLINNDNRFIHVSSKQAEEHEYLRDYSDNTDDWALDMDYYFAHKYGELPMFQDNEAIIGHMKRAVMTANFYKWDKLYETIKLDYNPIWNVDGEEIVTTVYGEHITNNSLGMRKANTLEQGYNFPYDENSKTQTAENSISVSSDAVNDSTVSNQHTDSNTIERHGNIGVTSTQHLISEERQIAMFSFWDIVYTDIIKAITIPVYEED